MENNIDLNQEISFETFKKQVLEDYRLIVTSREASLLGRREVLMEKQNLEFLETVKNYLK